jgi:hypothetical protein
MQAYAMVQAKGGSKLKKSDIDDARVSPIEGNSSSAVKAARWTSWRPFSANRRARR